MNRTAPIDWGKTIFLYQREFKLHLEEFFCGQNRMEWGAQIIVSSDVSWFFSYWWKSSLFHLYEAFFVNGYFIPGTKNWHGELFIGKVFVLWISLLISSLNHHCFCLKAVETHLFCCRCFGMTHAALNFPPQNNNIRYFYLVFYSVPKGNYVIK